MDSLITPEEEVQQPDTTVDISTIQMQHKQEMEDMKKEFNQELTALKDRFNQTQFTPHPPQGQQVGQKPVTPGEIVIGDAPPDMYSNPTGYAKWVVDSARSTVQTQMGNQQRVMGIYTSWKMANPDLSDVDGEVVGMFLNKLGHIQDETARLSEATRLFREHYKKDLPKGSSVKVADASANPQKIPTTVPTAGSRLSPSSKPVESKIPESPKEQLSYIVAYRKKLLEQRRIGGSSRAKSVKK